MSTASGPGRTYVTELSVPRIGDDGIQRLHSQMLESEPPATAADVLAVWRGEITGPEAGRTLASYFRSDAEPRYDTPEARAEAELEAGS
jgi:hypothetical protein